MGSAYGAVFFGVALIIIAVVYGILGVAVIGLTLTVFAGSVLYIGKRRNWFDLK